MAILRSVLGTVTQSFGGITATTWKDKNVLKQKVSAHNTSNSVAQAAQRRKFAILAKLAGQAGGTIRVGFRLQATDRTEQNVFQSVNKGAVTDNGTIAQIDYSQLVFSTGNVGVVAGLTLAYNVTTGAATVNYADNSNGGDALPTDILYVVVVDSGGGKAYSANGPMRSNGGAPLVFNIDKDLDGTELSAYAFFKRANTTATGPSTVATL